MRAVLRLADRTEHHPHALAGRADYRFATGWRRAGARRSDVATRPDGEPPRAAERCAPASPGTARASNRAAAELRLSAGKSSRSSRLGRSSTSVELIAERTHDLDEFVELLLEFRHRGGGVVCCFGFVPQAAGGQLDRKPATSGLDEDAHASDAYGQQRERALSVQQDG